MLTKKLMRIALATVVVLLIPLVAMQFTDEVNWNWLDFVVAGALLFGSGALYSVIASLLGKRSQRFAVGAAVAGVLILVWMQLAVGII